MRIIVTRTGPSAELTAAKLREHGHQAMIAPLSATEATGLAPPAVTFDAVLVTSANAIRSCSPEWIGKHAAIPVFAVGARTAAGAHAAGFMRITEGPGDAEGLAALVTDQVREGAHLLYLAGEPRKETLEKHLAAAGFAVTCHVVYRTRYVDHLPDVLSKALRARSAQGVLHYSRQAAECFARLSIKSGLGLACGEMQHFCLSHDVAEGLRGLGLARIVISPHPEENAMLAMLDKQR